MEKDIDQKIDLHESARKNINEKINNLLLKLSPAKSIKIEKVFKTDTPSIKINLQDVEIKSLNTRDYTGRIVERYFSYNNQNIGLDLNDYKEFLRIIDEFYKNYKIKQKVTKEFLEDKIFYWFESKYKGKIKGNIDDYIINEINNSIQIFDIRIPVAFTEIESQFDFGEVTFMEFRSDLITDSYNDLLNNHRNLTKSVLDESFNFYRNKFQGKAIVKVKVFAEEKRAKEIAFEKSEQAISLLRFFHDSSKSPYLSSNTYLYGTQNPITHNYFYFKNNYLINYSNTIMSNFNLWLISNKELQEYKKWGFNILSNLLTKKRNDFEEKLLDSLILFSKCSINNTLSEKLTAIIIAIESIFIKNENEPLMQNLADRIAFFISNEAKERIKITKIIKEAYKLRSKFLHHGRKVDDIELFAEFMQIIWYCFYLMILFTEKKNIDSHEKFIEYIDNRKYS